MPETHSPARHNTRTRVAFASAIALGASAVVLAYGGDSEQKQITEPMLHTQPLQQDQEAPHNAREAYVNMQSTAPHSERAPKVSRFQAREPIEQSCWDGTLKDLSHAQSKQAIANIAIACSLAQKREWYTNQQMECLVTLWDEESGWRERADNPNSSAYGIPQALPGEKMRTAGKDWATNPATQIKWGLGYISGRYGTACSALDAKHSKGWY